MTTNTTLTLTLTLTEAAQYLRLKCPKCGGPVARLPEFPPDRTNLYCQNRGNCGWMAWADIDLADSINTKKL